MKNSRKHSLRRRLVSVVLGFGAILLLVAVVGLLFGDAILSSYCKGKLQRAFAAAHPGFKLRIGALDYAAAVNRLVAQSVTLSGTNSTLKFGRITLKGIHWSRLLWGGSAFAELLAKASVEATNIDWEFPQTHYVIHCARLQASVPASELTTEGTELRTLVEDEQFFAAHEYRMTRFHVVLPECKVSGLAYGELLQGKSWRARSVRFSQPSFDALVNRDKPEEPLVKPPLMVHEALATIRQPLQIDSLSITNGHATYRERVVAGAEPGVLTFAAVNISAEGISNQGDASAAILLRAQGDLMDAGLLKVQMSIPITPPDFSLHYSGSLSAMDLTRLDAFLDIAERTRIKSGHAQEAEFDIDVSAGRARGRVRAIYRNLEIAVLDKQTDTAKGMRNRVASFLTNTLKIRSSNGPDTWRSIKEGKVNYSRTPGDEFIQFEWFALRTGVLDVITN